MGNLEAIYLHLNVPLQHVACSLEGWRVGRVRYRGAFNSLLAEAERRTFWSETRIRTFRDERLRSFIRHCSQTVPFYRQLFKQLRINPEDIRTLEDLAVLPILTKRE